MCNTSKKRQYSNTPNNSIRKTAITSAASTAVIPRRIVRRAVREANMSSSPYLVWKGVQALPGWQLLVHLESFVQEHFPGDSESNPIRVNEPGVDPPNLVPRNGDRHDEKLPLLAVTRVGWHGAGGVTGARRVERVGGVVGGACGLELEGHLDVAGRELR